MSTQPTPAEASWQRDIDLAFLEEMLARLDQGDTASVRAMITDWIADFEKEGA